MIAMDAFRGRRFPASAMLWVLLVMAPGFMMMGSAQSVVLDVTSGHAIAGEIARVSMEAFVRGGALPTRIVLEGTYDSAFLKLEAAIPGPGASAAKKNVNLTVNLPGRFRVEVIGDCVNGCTNVIGSGTLFYMDFRTNPPFVSKVLPITLTINQVFDSQNRPVPSTSRNGLVIVNDGLDPSNDLYIAQVASGIQSPSFGGYETYVLLTNLLATTTGVLVEFFGEDGQPLNTDIGGNYDNTFFLEITGNSTLTFETNSNMPMKKGWMRIRANSPVGSNVLYSYVNAEGRVVSQTGILPSVLMRSFLGSVDTRTNKIIGLAVANPNITKVFLDLELRDLAGTVKAQAHMEINPLAKLAMVLDEIFPRADLRNFVGSVVVSTSGQEVVATTLRFSGDLQIFTSQQVFRY